MHNTTNATMVTQVKVLLDSFNLFDKVVAYVKDKISNLNILSIQVFFLVLLSNCHAHL